MYILCAGFWRSFQGQSIIDGGGAERQRVVV